MNLSSGLKLVNGKQQPQQHGVKLRTTSTIVHDPADLASYNHIVERNNRPWNRAELESCVKLFGTFVDNIVNQPNPDPRYKNICQV